MSITKPKKFDAWYDYSPTETFDYDEITLAIGGKCIRVFSTVSAVHMAELRNDFDLRARMKQDMAIELVNHMVRDKLMEFTEYHDNIYDTYKISARCFLLPNDQIKLLRVNKVI